MNPEQLALLRGIKTSLLHLIEKGPRETLPHVTDAYLAVRRAEVAVPLKGISLPAPPMHPADEGAGFVIHAAGALGEALDVAPFKSVHPMHAVALQMAEEKTCNQPVGFEPFEAAP